MSPAGPGQTVIELEGEFLEIHTYFPRHVTVKDILLLLDGLHRDAAGIRDKAIATADRFGLLLVAPRLNKESFPKWRYHYGGVICDGRLQHQRDWTGKLIQALIDQLLTQTGRDTPRVYVFGHSAGAQLLSRICAYSPLSNVDAVIIANPSSYVMPLLDESAPFGFKNIFPWRQSLAKLQAYLAVPMTIYLGMEDTQDLHLSQTKHSMRQGKNRLERGRNLYYLGRQIAQVNRCRFNWRLIEVPGVGHSSRGMLESANFAKVLPSCGDNNSLS
jgi:poly(3-hydroxybutyrate) depolymerase